MGTPPSPTDQTLLKKESEKRVTVNEEIVMLQQRPKHEKHRRDMKNKMSNITLIRVLESENTENGGEAIFEETKLRLFKDSHLKGK